MSIRQTCEQSGFKHFILNLDISFVFWENRRMHHNFHLKLSNLYSNCSGGQGSLGSQPLKQFRPMCQKRLRGE